MTWWHSTPVENLNGERCYCAVGSHRRLRAVLVYIAQGCTIACVAIRGLLCGSS
jgi:hypothetical protein